MFKQFRALSRPRTFAAIIGIALAVMTGVAISAVDKYQQRVPAGLALEDFRGYERWEVVSVSHSRVGDEGNDVLNVVVANPTMIAAYASGIPLNGEPFPDGAKTAKIQYLPRKSEDAPFVVSIPDKLKDVELMVKDARQFALNGGWGYAKFNYDVITDTFIPAGRGASCGAACHTLAKAKDAVFTQFAKR